jgi:hypothetical protein
MKGVQDESEGGRTQPTPGLKGRVVTGINFDWLLLDGLYFEI